MASKVAKPKSLVYPPIQRGSSLTIPVTIKSDKDLPLDLTGTEINFTLKAAKSDFDMSDSRAYVTKTFIPQEPLLGKFYIQFSSADLNFEPGDYYFDIELTRVDGAVYRLCTLTTSLIGGPTNRTINPEVGQLPVGDEITVITLAMGNPIIIVANPVIISSATIVKIDETVARVDALELQVDLLTQDLEEIKTEVLTQRDILDPLNTNYAQLAIDLRQVANDLVALTQRVDRL